MRPALFLVTLLALAGVSQASGSGLLAPVQPALDTAGLGDVSGAADAISPPEAAPAAGPPAPTAFDCGGTAPVTATCETVVSATGTPTLRVDVGTGFTGTVVATLLDAKGDAYYFTCAYTLFVGGVTPGPTCQQSGTRQDASGHFVLAPGELRLQGAAVPNASPGAPPAGYWEVRATF